MFERLTLIKEPDIIPRLAMEPNSFFIIYSKSDEANILPLINDIDNVIRFPLDHSRDQLDESTKIKILKCNVFVCFLSTNCSKLFLDIVKFTRYVARKEINAYYIQPDKFDDFLKKEQSDLGIQNFFKYKTTRISSISDLGEVNIYLY
jgi:hypothetical protein